MSFLSTLKKVSNIDIYDANYNLSSEEFKDLIFSAEDGTIRISIFVRFLIYLKGFLTSIIGFNFSYKINKSENISFIFSKNQETAIIRITKKNINFQHINYFRNKKVLPMGIAYLMSLLFVPKVIKLFYQSTGYKRFSFKLALDNYILNYGYYLIIYKLLKKNKTKLIILANDHIMFTRAINLVAKELNIRTIYVQHASVSELFPPLSFDFALLEGYDSLKKYNKLSNCKAFLIGNPILDEKLSRINLSKEINLVGICVNNIDPIDAIEGVIKHLRNEIPELKIILRPHPDDYERRLRFWEKFVEEYGVKLSNPLVELPFDYLVTVDAIIANESNILLEAAILNVYPIIFSFNGDFLDVYGFLKNKLTDRYFTNPTELLTFIKKIKNNKPVIREKTKYYCANIGTPYEGGTTELAAKLFTEIINKNIDMSVWERVNWADKIEAYELKNAWNKN